MLLIGVAFSLRFSAMQRQQSSCHLRANLLDGQMGKFAENDEIHADKRAFDEAANAAPVGVVVSAAGFKRGPEITSSEWLCSRGRRVPATIA
jgi:hypothetical protein